MLAKTHELAYANDALGSIGETYTKESVASKAIASCRYWITKAEEAGEHKSLCVAMHSVVAYWEGRMLNRKAYGQWVYSKEYNDAQLTIIRAWPMGW